MRNMLGIAAVFLALQLILLQVVAQIFEALVYPACGAIRRLYSYSIDHIKFDETKHWLSLKSKSSTCRFRRKRRRPAASGWQVLVYERYFRWKTCPGSREYELPIVMPNQVLQGTSAECLWFARLASYIKKLYDLISRIHRSVCVNFRIYEVDSASSNKRYLAAVYTQEKLAGLIVLWIFCTLHLHHAIQATVMSRVPGFFDLMSALYSMSLVFRGGIAWVIRV